MPAPTLRQARKHQNDLAETAVEASVAVSRLITAKAPWVQTLGTMVTYQTAAAALGANQMAQWLDVSPQTDPTAYAGVSSYGYGISEPIVATIDKVIPAPVEELPDPWWDDAQAFIQQVEQLIASEMMDAARTAAQAEMVAQDVEEYVWLLNPPSCKRCVPLAGKIYRARVPRPRHPGCDCIQVPVKNKDQAIAEGFLLDPMVLFERGQILGLSKADTRAIQDGADLNEVVNATRGGLRTPGITSALTVELFGRKLKATTAGTTKRGAWRKKNPSRLVRLRPEAIYEITKDEDDPDAAAKRLLRLDGYIKDDTEVVPSTGGAGGAGGNGGHPAPPAPAEPPEPPETDHDYWNGRAAQTGADLGGENGFTPGEVKFLERFVRDRGERLTWIPTSPVMTPTNDFIWHSNGGIRVELKSPASTKINSIARRISEAVYKANRAGVTKENFVIDLGPMVLTVTLREQLADYNTGRPATAITNLWVLSEDGKKFEQIQLRT